MLNNESSNEASTDGNANNPTGGPRNTSYSSQPGPGSLAGSASHFAPLRNNTTSPTFSQSNLSYSLPRFYNRDGKVPSSGRSSGSNGGQQPLKEQLRLLLDEPNSSSQAFSVSIFIALIILFSSILGIVETVPQYYRSMGQTWYVFEGVIGVLFTIEFLLRAYAHTSTSGQFRRFVFSFFTIVDVIALVPFYMSFFVFNDNVADMQRLMVLRLFRLLRLLRCYTFSSLLQLSIDALVMAVSKSTEALMAMMVFIVFVIVTFSTLLYFAERGKWDPLQRAFVDVSGYQSQFDSIPAAIWFVAEVMTTIGLGDIYPRTVIGKLITIPLMLFSLLIIALPSIVIGRNFAESWAWLRSTQRPTRLAVNLAPTISSPSLSHHDALSTSTNTSSPTNQQPQGTMRGMASGQGAFLAELSMTQLANQIPVDLTDPTERYPLPAPSTSVGDHGEVMLGILQELQRQNELLERLLVANGQNYGIGSAGLGSFPLSPPRPPHSQQ